MASVLKWKLKRIGKGVWLEAERQEAPGAAGLVFVATRLNVRLAEYAGSDPT